MHTLTKFIEDQNRWNTLFGLTAITFPLTQTTVDSIARSLDSKLSPENLHCDGEISVAEANRKYRFYTKVYRELEQYCANNRLNTPVVYEL
jgi:hypothetical protein